MWILTFTPACNYDLAGNVLARRRHEPLDDVRIFLAVGTSPVIAEVVHETDRTPQVNHREMLPLHGRC